MIGLIRSARLIRDALQSSTVYGGRGAAQFAGAIDSARRQTMPGRRTAEGPMPLSMLRMELATTAAPIIFHSHRDADRPGSPGIAPTVKTLEWQSDYWAAERELAGLSRATAARRDDVELTLLNLQGTVEQDAYSAATALVEEVVPEHRTAELTRLVRLADDRSMPLSARSFWLAGLERALDVRSMRDGAYPIRTPLSSAYDQRALTLFQKRPAVSSVRGSASVLIAEQQATDARTNVYIWAAQLNLDKKVIPALVQRAARLQELAPETPAALLAQSGVDLAVARQEADSGQMRKHWARLEVFAADPTYHSSLRSTQNKIASILGVSPSTIGMPKVGRSAQLANLEQDRTNEHARLLEAAWQHAVGANTALAPLTVKQAEIEQAQQECMRLERNPPKPPASSGELSLDGQRLDEFETSLEQYERELVDLRGKLEVATAERNKIVALYRAERALVDQRMAEAQKQEAAPGTPAQARARADEFRDEARLLQAEFELANAEEADARLEAETTRFQIERVHDYLHGTQIKAQARRDRQTLLTELGVTSPTSLKLRPVLDLLDDEAMRTIYQFSPHWNELLNKRAASKDRVLGAQKSKIEIHLAATKKRRDRLGELVQQAERDDAQPSEASLRSLKGELKTVQDEVLDLSGDLDYATFLTGLPLSQRVTAADIDRAKAKYVFDDKRRLQRGFNRVADGLATLPRNVSGKFEATIGDELDWYLATAMGYSEGLSLADSGMLRAAPGREFGSVPSATPNSAPLLDEQAAYAVTQARDNIRGAGLKDGARLEFDLVPAALAGERQGGIRHFMFLKFAGADGQIRHIGPDGSIYKNVTEFLQDKGAGRSGNERFYAPADLTLTRDEQGDVIYTDTAAYVPSEQEKAETAGDGVAAVAGTVGGILAAIPVTSPFGWIIVGGTIAYGGYRIVKGSYLEHHYGRSLNPFENPTMAGYAVSLSAMGLGIGAGATRLAAGGLGRLSSPLAVRAAGTLQTASNALGVSSAIVGGYDTVTQTLDAFDPSLNETQRSEAILYAVLGLLDVGTGVAAPRVAEKIAKPRDKGAGGKGTVTLGEETIPLGPLDLTLPMLPLAKHDVTTPENRQRRRPVTVAGERPLIGATMQSENVVHVDPPTDEIFVALGAATWRIDRPLLEQSESDPSDLRRADRPAKNIKQQDPGTDDLRTSRLWRPILGQRAANDDIHEVGSQYRGKAPGGWRTQLETELLNGTITDRHYRALLDGAIGILGKLIAANRYEPLDYLAKRWSETAQHDLIKTYGAERAVKLTYACTLFEDRVLPLVIDEHPVKLGSLARGERHERHGDIHNRAVRYVVNQAMLWARAISASESTLVAEVPRAVVAETAAFLVVQLRTLNREMSQSLILRDADHYFTQYTQEWQTTKLRKSKKLPPSRLFSHASCVVKDIYDLRKSRQLNRELAGEMVPKGIEEGDMPASAPGGRGWATLGAQHFRADANTMRDGPERHEILTEMPAKPGRAFGKHVRASKPDNVFRFNPNEKKWLWAASTENPVMAIRRRRRRDVLLAFEGTRKSWSSPYPSNPINIATNYQGDVAYFNGIGTTGVMPNFGALTGRGWVARAQSAERYLASFLATGPVSLDILGFSRGAANARALANMLARWTREGQAEGLRLRSLILMDTVAGNHLGQGVRSRMLRVPDEVEYTWHAVALHEGRPVFPVESIERYAQQPNSDPKRMERAFIGGHGDVGGGDPGDLANVALHWMTLNAAAQGVPIKPTELEVNSPISYNPVTKITQLLGNAGREVRYPNDPSWKAKVQQGDRIYGIGRDDAEPWIVRVPGGKNTDVGLVADMPAYVSGLERRGDYFPASTERWRDSARAGRSIERPTNRIHVAGQSSNVRPVRLSPEGERIFAAESFPEMQARRQDLDKSAEMSGFNRLFRSLRSRGE